MEEVKRLLRERVPGLEARVLNVGIVGDFEQPAMTLDEMVDSLENDPGFAIACDRGFVSLQRISGVVRAMTVRINPLSGDRDCWIGTVSDAMAAADLIVMFVGADEKQWGKGFFE